MAILNGMETPSSDDDGKKQNTESTFLKYTRIIISFCQRSIRFILWIGQKFVFVVKSIKIGIRDFLVSGRYLPHFVLLFILIIVAVSNLTEIAQAAAINQALVSVDPQTEMAVASGVDHFTPLIPNGSDMVEKSNSAIVSEEGFSANIAPVETQITARTVPLPDNSKQTVDYVVRPGDTLSGLEMAFGVNLATFKYLNNITDVNIIRPGLTLKIPPRGYAVSQSVIDAKAKQAQLALAAKNKKATRTQSTATSNQQYAGTINGVRYIRKAKANELQCYGYVTSLGYPVGGHALARWIPTNSDTPAVGGLVVTYESFAGHVAVVIGVNDDGTFDIRESNYTHGWITERTLSVHNSLIKGFVN